MSDLRGPDGVIFKEGPIQYQPLPPAKATPDQISAERATLSALQAHIRAGAECLPVSHYRQLRASLLYTSATLSNYLTAIDDSERAAVSD